jgi:hypothetical protein
MKRHAGWVIGLVLVLLPFELVAQYRAEDITVPPGYRVIKVAETNKIIDPYRFTFDAGGNLILASYTYLIYKIDPYGRIEVIGHTRKYDISPQEIEVSPDGTYILRGGILNSSRNGIWIFAPPDSYRKVIEAASISATAFDKLGNFYASIWEPIPNSNPVAYQWAIKRYDANFVPVETVFTMPSLVDFAFDNDNNLYVSTPGSKTDNYGFITKVLKGGDGIPHGSSPKDVIATGLFSAANMAVDDAGNIYLDEYRRTVTNGYSTYKITWLTMITASGTVARVPDLEMVDTWGIGCRGNTLFASENSPGLISQIDLSSFEKSNFTEDFGLDGPGALAWDANDQLFTTSFRQARILKLNSQGTFEQLGPGTGNIQSLVSDGTNFYAGSAPFTANNPWQILKIDPATGAQTPVATNVKGWRTVEFDAFGRLILNTVFSESLNQFGADIIDLTTGAVTNYLTGLHNKGRCLRFDARQNIYFVEGNGDGIKKVGLPPAYAPARDLSSESLFYNFVTPGLASPTIYYFALNSLEELFVPRMDSRDVLYCDPSGSVSVFARGFIQPLHASIDRFGALYISDSSNGIFKIVHERWAVPAVIKIKDTLLNDLLLSGLDTGVKNSLAQKLKNADKHLTNGRITPAMNEIEAFVNEIKAQNGKKIPTDLAAKWIQSAAAILKALKEIE